MTTIIRDPSRARTRRDVAANPASRSIRQKLADVRSIRDFVAADDAARLVAAIADGTGVIHVPTDAAALGDAEIGVNGYSQNDSTQDFSDFLYNAGETARNTVTRHAKHVKFTGTNLTKRRIANTLRMESEGAGDNLANNGTADIGQLINAFKSNFRTTTIGGEIDAQVIVVRQGGSFGENKSDAAGTLYDVVSYSGRFITAVEGSTATYTAGSPDVLTRRVRYFVGVIDNANDFAVGFSAQAEVGATTHGVYLVENAGAQFGNYIYCGSGNFVRGAVYTVDRQGRQVANLGAPLATTVNAEIIASDTSALSVNDDRLRQVIYRTVAAGADFKSAAWRMQRRVDASALGFLEFNADATTGGSIVSLGYGAPGASTLLFSATQDGKVGFGVAPVARTSLGAVATDNATTLALLNKVRTALIGMNLATA